MKVWRKALIPLSVPQVYIATNLNLTMKNNKPNLHCIHKYIVNRVVNRLHQLAALDSAS